MTHIEYRTQDGVKKKKCKDLGEALRLGYEQAMDMPLDPHILPEVSVFDNHGFVVRIDKLKIINRDLANTIK